MRSAKYGGNADHKQLADTNTTARMQVKLRAALQQQQLRGEGIEAGLCAVPLGALLEQLVWRTSNKRARARFNLTLLSNKSISS